MSQYECVGATRGYKKWTPDEDRKLADAIESGMTGQELGDVLPGRTHQAAKGRKDSLRKQGLIS